MTTVEKLNLYKEKTGRNWGNIAVLLGISRQMLGMVRRGERDFGEAVKTKLNVLFQQIETNTEETTTPKISVEIDQRSKLPTLCPQCERLNDVVKAKDAIIVSQDKLIKQYELAFERISNLAKRN